MSDPAFGVDISTFQGNINWAKLVAGNVKFVFVRAKYGTFDDARFKMNWPGAKAAGLLRGAYLFYRPKNDASPIAQAEAFVNSLGGDFGELPLVVDVERDPGQEIPPVETLQSGLRACLERITQLTGRKPIIYTALGFWNESLGSVSWAKDYDLWVANWVTSWTSESRPLLPNAWTNYRFWQFAADGNQQGANLGVESRDLDLNLFNGDVAALSAYANGHPVIITPDEGVRERSVWVNTDIGLSFRSQPMVSDDNLLAQLPFATPITAIGEPSKAASGNEWQKVRLTDGRVGFVLAFIANVGLRSLSNKQPQVAVAMKPVQPNQVRPGESPYIFGIHDPYDRTVLARANRTGWVLFTEEMGTNADSLAGRRDEYADWSHNGYGVIARLNHGYGANGTIPDPDRFDAFAQACAAWVRKSANPNDPLHGCHIWIIGNELNNPREWPGNDVSQGNNGREITPENYAECFNRVRDAIKAVQPDAIVCLGAIDPYHPNSCKAFWARMFPKIRELDGIAIHAYTHGSDPNLIIDTKKFDNDPLTWQFFNFQAYRTTLELVPARFRDRPVFLTESDQVVDWADTNSGWVRKAYDEIERWNSQPDNVQQIRCLLLFSWDHKDDGRDYRIQDKGGVREDFSASAFNDYRWRVPVLPVGANRALELGIAKPKRRRMPKTQLVVTKSGATLRSRPVNGSVLARLKLREALILNDVSDVGLTQIGKRGHWLAVTDGSGRAGYVAAQAVKLATKLGGRAFTR